MASTASLDAEASVGQDTVLEREKQPPPVFTPEKKRPCLGKGGGDNGSEQNNPLMEKIGSVYWEGIQGEGTD